MADDAMIRRENLGRLGKSPTELAAILGKTPGYWSNLLRDPKKSFGEKSARRIEEVWPLPRLWLDEVHEDSEVIPAPGGKGVAQDLSLATPTMAPKEVTWGDVVAGNLPKSFSLRLRDDALGGMFPRGSIAIFETGIEPIDGRGVLFTDREGEAYVRNYQLRRGAHWLAIAAPEAAAKYAPLDSEVDGLSIVAVMVGAKWA